MLFLRWKSVEIALNKTIYKNNEHPRGIIFCVRKVMATKTSPIFLLVYFNAHLYDLFPMTI